VPEKRRKAVMETPQFISTTAVTCLAYHAPRTLRGHPEERRRTVHTPPFLPFTYKDVASPYFLRRILIACTGTMPRYRGKAWRMGGRAGRPQPPDAVGLYTASGVRRATGQGRNRGAHRAPPVGRRALAMSVGETGGGWLGATFVSSHWS